MINKMLQRKNKTNPVDSILKGMQLLKTVYNRGVKHTARGPEPAHQKCPVWPSKWV